MSREITLGLFPLYIHMLPLKCVTRIPPNMLTNEEFLLSSLLSGDLFDYIPNMVIVVSQRFSFSLVHYIKIAIQYLA